MLLFASQLVPFYIIEIIWRTYILLTRVYDIDRIPTHVMKLTKEWIPAPDDSD